VLWLENYGWQRFSTASHPTISNDGERAVIKKLFDWTGRDIAYWEKVRQKGLRSFIAWYGVLISGGLLFILFGLVTFFGWLRQFSGAHLTQTSLTILVGQLIFVALVSLLAGIVNSLITWVVEERLYRKYKMCNPNVSPTPDKRRID